MKNQNIKRASLAYEDSEFLNSEEGAPATDRRGIFGADVSFFRRAESQATLRSCFSGQRAWRPTDRCAITMTMRANWHVSLTLWSQSLTSNAHRYVVCSGGGGGIMEAANRGAAQASAAER